MSELIYDWTIYRSLLRTTLHFLFLAASATVLLYLATRLVARFRSPGDSRLFVVALAAVSLLGGLTGFSGGISRTGVVGDLMPAALTFLAGTVAYLFGIKEKKDPVIAILVVAFAVSMFLNYSLGAGVRHAFERRTGQRSDCVKIFSNKDILANDKAYARAVDLFGKRCRRVVETMTPETPTTNSSKSKQGAAKP